MRCTNLFATCLGLAAIGLPAVAQAAEVTVVVDSRSPPWRTGLNPKKAFGYADGRAPTVVWKLGLIAGLKLTFTATGWTTTVIGGGQLGPGGQGDWTADRGGALFPSHYIPRSNRAVHLNELVGCFIDADGVMVGKPFAIGAAAEIEIPEGAAALSLGINDDRYSDNTGSLSVTIRMPEPSVTVETNESNR